MVSTQCALLKRDPRVPERRLRVRVHERALARMIDASHASVEMVINLIDHPDSPYSGFIGIQ
jgi:hypothetical protein